MNPAQTGVSQQGLPQQLMQGGGQASPQMGGGMGQGIQAVGGAMGQLGQQAMSPAHDHAYNMLRNTLMSLLQQGVPGIDQVLDTLNKVHVDQYRPGGAISMPKKRMPQGNPQMPAQVGGM